MERSLIAEENHGRSDSTPLSVSPGSLIKIDSLCIDLSRYMDKNEPGKCEHFSIREYVAEMRKKDFRICLPFALDDNNKLEDQQTSMLPPLHVAKFRWWRCQNCLQEVGATSAAEELAIIPYCEKSGLIPNSTCTHINKHGDSSIVLSDVDQASKLENFERETVDANICSSKKEKSFEVGHHSAVIGHENGSKEDGNHEICNSTCDVTNSNPCPIEERHTDGIVAIKSKGKELVEYCEPNRLSHEVSKCLPAIENPKFLPGKLTSADHDQQRNVSMGCETPGVDYKINLPIDSVISQTSRLHSLEFQEHDNALTGHDEILSGNNLHNQQHDNSTGLMRRKTQKVRLLTDLLGANGKAKFDNIRTEDASSNEIDSLSAPAPHGHEPAEGNKGKGLMGHTKKRKMPRDEDWNPVEMSFSNNSNKKFRVFKGNIQSSNMGIKISDPESQENASAGVGLQTDTKYQLTKHRTNRSAVQCKGKNKVSEVGEGFSLLAPFQNVSPKKIQTQIGVADKFGGATDSGFPKSAHDTLSYGGLQSYFRNPFPPQQIGRNSVLRKKKNKVPRDEDAQAPFIPPRNSTLGDGSIIRKDAISPIFPQQKAVPEEGHFRKKDDMSFGESSVLPDCSSEGHFDLNESIARRTSFLRKMQNQATLVEDRSFQLHQNLGISGTRNNDKTIEAKESSDATKKYSGKRSDKVFEEGKSDDIPMDVVELLAKIRYDRLHEAERSSCVSEGTIDSRNNDIIGCSKVHGNGVLRSAQEKNSYQRKPESSNPKNGTVMKGEYVGPGKLDPVDYFSRINGNHLNMEKVDRNPAFTGFSSFPQNQEKLSGGVQFSTSGPIRNRSTQYFRFNGDNPVQGHEASNTCQNGSDFLNTLRKGKMITGFDSESSERMSLEFPFVGRQVGTQRKTKEVGPLDIYPNETIPAMQLLSLMDAGVQSSTPFRLDGKSKFSEKPFFPCDHHPKVCLDGKSKFLEKPFNPCNHHSSAIGTGVYIGSESSRNPSSLFYGKSHLLDKSCECSPSVGEFSSLFQQNGSSKRAAGFTGQVSSKSWEQEMVNSNSPMQGRGRKLQSVDLEERGGNGTVWLTKNISGIEICKLNRNPADFTIPGAENVFMIRSEDLRSGKKILSSNRSSLMNVDGRKRQRGTKIKGMKVNSQLRIL